MAVGDDVSGGFQVVSVEGGQCRHGGSRRGEGGEDWIGLLENGIGRDGERKSFMATSYWTWLKTGAVLIGSLVLLATGFAIGRIAGQRDRSAGGNLPLAENHDSLTPNQPARVLVLVSIDGFRWEYLNRNITPNIAYWGQKGTIGRLTPSYPAKTFPNHLTLVTGRYPESHGIVANKFYDPISNETYVPGRSEPHWYCAEPIWCTAEANGIVTASLYWPGSEVDIGGIRPTYWEKFNSTMPIEARVEKVMQWLTMPSQARPQFITAYFNQLDDEGHAHGPQSAMVNQSLQEIDKGIGQLIGGIESAGLETQVNLVIVSDHGMTSITRKKVILLDDYVAPNAAKIFYGDMALIYPNEGFYEDILVNITTAKEKNGLAVEIYTKESMPETLHYNDSVRIPPIVVAAHIGWEIGSREAVKEHSDWFDGGDHGYDNTDPDMTAVLIAAGPSLARIGILPQPIANVDLYSLLAVLLHVTPLANNGSLTSLADLVSGSEGRAS